VKEGKDDSIHKLSLRVEGTSIGHVLIFRFPKDPLYNIGGSSFNPVFFLRTLRRKVFIKAFSIHSTGLG
jgi:hypothetical protein